MIYGAALTFGFVSVAWSLERSLEFLIDWSFAFRLALVWVLFVFAWAVIDALRRQQDELIAMRERLVRNEDMALLGEVSAGVAHEVNNPIAIIAACADYLKQTLPPEAADAREEIDTIHNEARRCKRIVQDLLDFASPEQSAEIREIDLRRLCDQALAPLMTRDWERPPRIIRRHDEPIQLVRGDPGKLTQVLRNIFSNAHHFMGPDGKLVISAYSLPGDHKAPWATVLEISDNGPGIPAKHVKRVFTPFFSRRKGGTGLGLAIARRIVEAHGGQIEARSPGEEGGATFIIRLPGISRAAPGYDPPREGNLV
jgi:signal transduction histidine kinase